MSNLVQKKGFIDIFKSESIRNDGIKKINISLSNKKIPNLELRIFEYFTLKKNLISF
ncbi:hypothetical protein D3C86_1862700 [compost metagenome]